MEETTTLVIIIQVTMAIMEITIILEIMYLAIMEISLLIQDLLHLIDIQRVLLMLI